MPLKVPTKIEMTSPKSKLRYKVTYPNGQQKWVKERPGHKSDKWKMRERKKLLRKPAVKDFFKKMEAVINKYLESEATEKDVEQVARDFETTIGWNKARMIIRRLAKTEKKKLDGLEEYEKGHQQDIVNALEIAVDYVARRRRDNPKEKEEKSKIEPKEKKANDMAFELLKIAKEILV